MEYGIIISLLTLVALEVVLGIKIPKGYIYFSMVFSLLVDILQMRMNKNLSKSVTS